MNIAFFITPKNMVSYLYDDFTVRQGLEKLRYHGYTAIPVITREGKYVGTVSEGDFLWSLIEEGPETEQLQPISIHSAEYVYIRDIMRSDHNPPVHITAAIEDMLTMSMNQNFIPVIDDMDNFIGIVTRRDIIKYFYQKQIGANLLAHEEEQRLAQ